MSQKRKRGLQSGLSDIIAKQTAPTEDKFKLSRGLIEKFADAREPPAAEATPATTEAADGQAAGQSAQPAQPVAPVRDFMKVANSIGRQAVPSGHFKGKGKQIYDFLYAKTRGAITPVRSIQISRQEIMAGANIGSDKTLRKNLLRLRQVGLIMWGENTGEHAGSVYTVNLPEEAEAMLESGYPGYPEYPGYPGYFLPWVPRVESTLGTQGYLVENKEASAFPKTYIKTDDDDDDDAFRVFREKMRFAARELTGVEPPPNEQQRWGEVADVLVRELREAAAKTGSVSSVPAFLSAHLRRRLNHKPSPRRKETPPATSVAGMPEPVAPMNAPARRLSDAEISEQSALIAELLQGGYTPEQAESQFGGSFHVEDWTAIRAAAVARAGGETDA